MISGAAHAGRGARGGVRPAFFALGTWESCCCSVTLWQAMRFKVWFREHLERLLACSIQPCHLSPWRTAVEHTEGGKGLLYFFCKRLETGSTVCTRPSAVADALQLAMMLRASVLTH